MKKIFFPLLLCVALVSCNKNECVESGGVSGDTILGVCGETVADGVKTTLNQNGLLVWNTVDKLSVLSYKASTAVVDEFEINQIDESNPTFATFKGSITTGASQYYAFYPGEFAARYNGTDIRFALPGEQTYAENTFPAGSFPSVAPFVSVKDNLLFKNICGLCKISLTGDIKVSKLVLTDLSGKNLWGDAVLVADDKIGTDNEQLSLTNGGSAITLDCGEGVQLSSAPTTFYFVVPKDVFTAGLKLSIYQGADLYKEVSTTSNNKTYRSKILAMPVINLGKTEETNINVSMTGKIWEIGDKIGANGEKSTSLDAAHAGEATATFTINQALTTPYNVLYPASAYANGNIVIPAAQSYFSGKVDPAAEIGVGTSSTENVSLSLVFGKLAVTVTKGGSETIKDITVEANENLCGTYSVDYATAVVTYVSDGSKKVTLAGDGSIPYASDKAQAVIALAPGTYTGVTVTINTTDSKKMVYAYASDVTLAKGGEETLALTFKAQEFSGGSGTEADPYQISCAKDMQTLSSYCSTADGLAKYGSTGVYYIMTADIDGLTLEYPISLSSDLAGFQGVFDGQNHEIKNLVIQNPGKGGTTNSALFGYMGTGGWIKNVVVRGYTPAASTTSQLGTIVASTSGGKVSNCKVYVGTISTKAKYAGVLAGWVQNGAVVENCIVEGSITTSGSYIGGIAGVARDDVTVTYCTVTGDITGGDYVGGIVGRQYTSKSTSSGTTSHCTFIGTVKGGSGKTNVHNIVGGISKGTIVDCSPEQ